MTVITDPHIKADTNYFVFTEGENLKVAEDFTGFIERGAFIRTHTGKNTFKGECWPEKSVWVDFLNENACNFWKSLYKYDKFKGTSKLFNYWIDMNEPSVFSG